MITAGLLFTAGRAERAPGGYRLTGRWPFGSGIWLHAFRTARSIVSRLYDLLQTASIYRPSPMDRWLRDTTMCQHIVAEDRILQSAGAYLLGGTPSFRLCLGIVS